MVDREWVVRVVVVINQKDLNQLLMNYEKSHDKLLASGKIIVST